MFGRYELDDLSEDNIALNHLGDFLGISHFQAHMLQQAVARDQKRHESHRRYREHDRKKAKEAKEAAADEAKTELRRRLAEMEANATAAAQPCGSI